MVETDIHHPAPHRHNRAAAIRRGIHLIGFPFPVTNFRHVLTVFIDKVLVLNQLVLHYLLEVSALRTKVRQAIHHVLDQMETIEVILNSHIPKAVVMVPSSLYPRTCRFRLVRR